MLLDFVLLLSLLEKIGILPYLTWLMPSNIPTIQAPSLPLQPAPSIGVAFFDTNSYIERLSLFSRNVLELEHVATPGSDIIIHTQAEVFFSKTCESLPIDQVIFYPTCPVLEQQPRYDIQKYSLDSFSVAFSQEQASTGWQLYMIASIFSVLATICIIYQNAICRAFLTTIGFMFVIFSITRLMYADRYPRNAPPTTRNATTQTTREPEFSTTSTSTQTSTPSLETFPSRLRATSLLQSFTIHSLRKVIQSFMTQLAESKLLLSQARQQAVVQSFTLQLLRKVVAKLGSEVAAMSAVTRVLQSFRAGGESLCTTAMRLGRYSRLHKLLLARARKEIRGCLFVIQSLRALLQKCRAKIQKLEDEVENFCVQVQDLNADNDDLLGQVDSLREDKARLETEVAQLRRIIASKDETFEQAKAERDASDADVKRLRNELERKKVERIEAANCKIAAESALEERHQVNLDIVRSTHQQALRNAVANGERALSDQNQRHEQSIRKLEEAHKKDIACLSKAKPDSASDTNIVEEIVKVVVDNKHSQTTPASSPTSSLSPVIEGTSTQPQIIVSSSKNNILYVPRLAHVRSDEECYEMLQESKWADHQRLDRLRKKQSKESKLPVPNVDQAQRGRTMSQQPGGNVSKARAQLESKGDIVPVAPQSATKVVIATGGFAPAGRASSVEPIQRKKESPTSRLPLPVAVERRTALESAPSRGVADHSRDAPETKRKDSADVAASLETKAGMTIISKWGDNNESTPDSRAIAISPILFETAVTIDSKWDYNETLKAITMERDAAVPTAAGSLGFNTLTSPNTIPPRLATPQSETLDDSRWSNNKTSTRSVSIKANPSQSIDSPKPASLNDSSWANSKTTPTPKSITTTFDWSSAESATSPTQNKSKTYNGATNTLMSQEKNNKRNSKRASHGLPPGPAYGTNRSGKNKNQDFKQQVRGELGFLVPQHTRPLQHMNR